MNRNTVSKASKRSKRRQRNVANNRGPRQRGLFSIPKSDELDRAQAMYLHSFVDPHHAARGPGNSQYPTALVNLHASSLITVSPANTATLSRTGTTHRPTLRMNDEGAIMFICGMGGWISSNAADGDEIGFTPIVGIDPDLTWTQGLLGSATVVPIGEANASHLGEWDIDYPDGCAIADISSPSDGARLGVQSRVVGLKAELETTTKLLDNQGFVYSGDLSLLYGGHDSGGVVTSAGHVNELAYNERASWLTRTRGDVSLNNRLCTGGPLLMGKIYEATFLPQNDHIEDYIHKVFGCPLDSSSSAYNHCVYSPQVAFVLRGMDPTATYSFRIGVTLALEFPVVKNSAVGILYREARYSNRYLANWAVFSRMRSGGALGTTHAGWLRSGEHSRVAHGVVARVLPQPMHNRPSQAGVSTRSLTNSVVAHAKDVLQPATAAIIDAAAPHVKAAAGNFFSRALSKGAHWLEGLFSKGESAAARLGGSVITGIEEVGPELLAGAEEIAPLAIMAL